ncbi:hypothetical protein [Pseudomonas sp. Tri1]|uniref:McrB family protein n=1 Tax=Pseudomonas sp. Tri1 TaxID=2823875 RepID=UPI001B342F1B|nr:hypothetical protein [Pseudomonas sp. Tri1]
MAIDLKDDDQLKAACESALQQYRLSPGHDAWLNKLSNFLLRVRNTDHQGFISEAFQKELWDSEAVSATGMGRIDISAVVKEPLVAECLWRLKSQSPDLDPVQQEQLINDTWSQVAELVEPLVKRNPRLKRYRLFAALCPEYFTTITHHRKLRELAVSMGISRGAENRLALHRLVKQRLDAVLGEPGPIFSQGWVERMTLPWLLYVLHVQNQELEATETADLTTGEEKLNPLPADRRRRGMLAIGGYVSTIRAMIEFAREGCTREDFREHMRSLNQALAPATISTQMNALIAEWGVLRADGDNLVLTPRGEGFLESGDPDEVSDWLLTRILGLDNLLYALKTAPMPTKAAVAELQKVNANWTSTFVPNSLINWTRALQLVELSTDKMLRLSDRGESWAARIHWVPDVLVIAAPLSTIADGSAASLVLGGSVERPPLKQIIASFDENIRFKDELIGQLDAGLWGHPRRHFAVLTGLSGAGKTLLARGYALGMRSNEDDPKSGLLIVPVQPGWHDPSCLLGYVNPLDSDTYVRTGFLDFLLQASADPDRPYTVVLDEMNLSHPEQYFSPLLSAMETGDNIELHAQGGEVNGVPPNVPYPSNLVIIGTVNMDETTHGLSDKVLDRAAVIEFWDIDVEAFPGWRNCELSEQQITVVRQTLKDLVQALRPVRLHFGWRTIRDVIGYVQEAERGGVIEFNGALDQAIYAKVLPKLRGEDSPRIKTAFGSVKKVLENADLKASTQKVHELLDDLQYLGSARFWR